MLRTRDIQPRGGKTNPPRTEAAPGKHRRGKKAPKRDGGGGSTGNSPLRFPAAGPDKQRCWLRRRGFSAFSPPRPPFTGSAGPGLPPSLPPSPPEAPAAPGARPRSRGSPAHCRLGLNAAPEERARPRRPRRRQGPTEPSLRPLPSGGASSPAAGGLASLRAGPGSARRRLLLLHVRGGRRGAG